MVRMCSYPVVAKITVFLGVCLGMAALFPEAAYPAVEIGGGSSVDALFRTSSGKYLLFYHPSRWECVYVVSKNATGTAWGKPVNLPSHEFRSAVMDAKDTVYIVRRTREALVLDKMVPAGEGWEYKKDAVVVCQLPKKGSVLSAWSKIHLDSKGQLWASCSWRVDEKVGGSNISINPYMVMKADAGSLKFQKVWEDKDGFIRNIMYATLGLQKGMPVVYSPRHYQCSLLSYDGKAWIKTDDLFDFSKSLANGWVSAYGNPPPLVGSTDNGYLHIVEFVVEHPDRDTYHLLVPPDGSPASIEEVGGGGERGQFLVIEGNHIVIGLKYSVSEYIDEIVEKYEEFYAVRYLWDAGTKKYKREDDEYIITESRGRKGGMRSIAKIKPGEDIPVVYLDNGKMFFDILKKDQ